MENNRIWTAALLIIGDEILSGRTEDKNIAQIASWLNIQGIRLTEVRVIPDDDTRIVAAVRDLKDSHDYLFTTGGIGPTHDDITVEGISHALDLPIVIHPDARKCLEEYYSDRGGLTPARLLMARVPKGSTLIKNPISGAPGIHIQNIFILAGVPKIVTTMLESLNGTLKGGKPVLSRTIGTWDGESRIAKTLRETEKDHPDCKLGSYPFFRNGSGGVNLVIRSTDKESLNKCAQDLIARLLAEDLSAIDGAI
ncbi:molybdenum cofactor biosynthesis protein [Zymomonas mobilis subsp. pomaceae]|uniref:Molybdopterin binding domain protein n=2 Tax=Zymomonas mobilis TaxID=542 RepID=F8ESU6_ZYMMT|nr:molybdopterin binding domain protein [Zymomonas mobilis subsp. pomaceae ATCC 29192]GEB89039.1 molybdenum cofactor biosynthesis protein [Zymomonas mobilis subsp. pomaceae]